MQLQNSFKFILFEWFKILIYREIIDLDNLCNLLIRNIFMNISSDYFIQFKIFTIHTIINCQKQTHHIFIFQINQFALEPKRVETEHKQLVVIILNKV